MGTDHLGLWAGALSGCILGRHQKDFIQYIWIWTLLLVSGSAAFLLFLRRFSERRKINAIHFTRRRLPRHTQTLIGWRVVTTTNMWERAESNTAYYHQTLLCNIHFDDRKWHSEGGGGGCIPTCNGHNRHNRSWWRAGTREGSFVDWISRILPPRVPLKDRSCVYLPKNLYPLSSCNTHNPVPTLHFLISPIWKQTKKHGKKEEERNWQSKICIINKSSLYKPPIHAANSLTSSFS